MMHYLIACRSLTYAQRTVRALSGAGISSRLLRTPKSVASEGCGYSVRIAADRLKAAVTALTRQDLRPKKIYVAEQDGQYREVVF